jgi:hypothetical protein
MRKKRQLTFKQLYSTLGSKQLTLFNYMANFDTPCIIIKDERQNKTLSLSGIKQPFNNKEIDKIISKGFMICKEIIKDELYSHELTDLNKKLFISKKKQLLI